MIIRKVLWVWMFVHQKKIVWSLTLAHLHHQYHVNRYGLESIIVNIKFSKNPKRLTWVQLRTSTDKKTAVKPVLKSYCKIFLTLLHACFTKYLVTSIVSRILIPLLQKMWTGLIMKRIVILSQACIVSVNPSIITKI